MRYVAGARQAGKTAAAIDWLVRNPEGVLVCANRVHARQAQERLAEALQAPRVRIMHRVVSIEDGPQELRGRRGALWIDDADQVLQTLLLRFGIVNRVEGIGFDDEGDEPAQPMPERHRAEGFGRPHLVDLDAD